jgi:lipopolysaccharide/colanic/teichoic acid biosynthesis glycosyltransferase
MAGPFMVLLACYLKVRYGQAFFVQVRPGLHERPFPLFKFSKYHEHGPQKGQLHRLGSFIQRSGIDELPQLWNVLRGEMSLVGPRPLLMEYLPLYNETQRRRHLVPPGITGWAQIHGRAELDFEKKFEYDVWYVEHKTMRLDWYIMWRTVLLLVKGEATGYDTTRWNG